MIFPSSLPRTLNLWLGQSRRSLNRISPRSLSHRSFPQAPIGISWGVVKLGVGRKNGEVKGKSFFHTSRTLNSDLFSQPEAECFTISQYVSNALSAPTSALSMVVYSSLPRPPVG